MFKIIHQNHHQNLILEPFHIPKKKYHADLESLLSLP